MANQDAKRKGQLKNVVKHGKESPLRPRIPTMIDKIGTCWGKSTKAEKRISCEAMPPGLYAAYPLYPALCCSLAYCISTRSAYRKVQ